MPPLRGPLQLVLQAVHDLQGDSTAYVEDWLVAQRVKMNLDDVRNCFIALEENGYVDTARTTEGRLAHITANGRLALPQPEVTAAGERRPATGPNPAFVRPKGLASFDRSDADFFLQLLPGPWDKDGLPDSLLYWKTRIEERDADRTFRVGVIWGPSGCGKSSLVKAGLLPKLDGRILQVYVEATPASTEAALRTRLRHRVPDLPTDWSLGERLATIRQQGTIPSDGKLLLVLDQFE
jgi:hypothetical protein